MASRRLGPSGGARDRTARHTNTVKLQADTRRTHIIFVFHMRNWLFLGVYEPISKEIMSAASIPKIPEKLDFAGKKAKRWSSGKKSTRLRHLSNQQGQAFVRFMTVHLLRLACSLGTYWPALSKTPSHAGHIKLGTTSKGVLDGTATGCL